MAQPPHLSHSDEAFLTDHFGVSRRRGNQQVLCPFHDDAEPSASINLGKGVLNCFGACGRGWTLTEVLARLRGTEVENDEDVAEVELAEPEVGAQDGGAPPGDLLALGEQLLTERLGGIPEIPGWEVYVDETPGTKTYGYLVFERADKRFVARNLLRDDRPRYLNGTGGKGLAIVGRDDRKQALWVTEGIFDALTLYSEGVTPVAALLGKDVSDEQAYHMRGRTVFLALDADFAGWDGARKAAEKLRGVGAVPIIVEMPDTLGKDHNDAWMRNGSEYRDWLNSVRAEYERDDSAYVTRLFNGEERALITLSTGISTWDRALGGGFRDGVHGVGAEPGTGKTAYALSRAKRWALNGLRVLYITYEISVRQSWVRVASEESKYTWVQLEADPTLVESAVRERLSQLARNLKVVAGWPLEKIQYAAEHYDVVIVDYLQRMPGPYGEDQSRQNINRNIRGLSDLARDKGKVVIVISSIPRSAYGSALTMSSWKESGDIEFVSQSLTGFQEEMAEGALRATIVKGTRGGRGSTFEIKTDLGHLKFDEVSLKDLFGEKGEQIANARKVAAAFR